MSVQQPMILRQNLLLQLIFENVFPGGIGSKVLLCLLGRLTSGLNIHEGRCPSLIQWT